MSDIVPTTEVTKRDLARGRNLRIAGISAPIVLTLIPLTVFLILTALFSGTPTVVISIIFFGIVATVVPPYACGATGGPFPKAGQQ